MTASTPTASVFRDLAREHTVIPMIRTLFSDRLTPVMGYRRLVAADDRTAPSFLFESVEGGAAAGRYSLIGAQPDLEVTARGHDVTVDDHRAGASKTRRESNPLDVPRQISRGLRPASVSELGVDAYSASGMWALPSFIGGWAGCAGYDTMRYLEPSSLPFQGAPADDRGLCDLHLGFYRNVAVFDHVAKVIHAIVNVFPGEHASPDAAYAAGHDELDRYVARLQETPTPLVAGVMPPPTSQTHSLESNMPAGEFQDAVRRARSYIEAGDIFQVVLSQRFRRSTAADPFDVYRTLRIVNPSPYMFYLQMPGAILVASSPEILCRCEGRSVVNRPLAGTRRRGKSADEDSMLAGELRADTKERAEHVMLVDLGRNDLGRVCELGSINLERIMDIERYSHVMHLSSTVTGRLRSECDAWDLLASSLPVGTVSGAPKVRAMQIIDELEPTRRGPYAGGVGFCGYGGDMDMAIALRTMVIPTAARRDGLWRVDLQAGAGIVADSDPDLEHAETVHKSAALARAIDLAESAFGPG